MPKSEKIKGYGDHFRVFSLYLRLDCGNCQEQMKQFFRCLPNAGTAKNSDKKIEKWWAAGRKPHDDAKPDINAFFRGLAEKSQKSWDDHWLDQSLKELEVHELLEKAVKKFQQPYAIARVFKAYEKDGLLKKIINKFCIRKPCYFIYRVHTDGRILVRDVLRFRGHDEEKIFCTIYQYTSHNLENQKRENIKEFSGNVFFNSTHLFITFVSENYDLEQGPQYGNIVCPRFHESKERLGILMALTDQNNHPAAAAILIREADISYPFDLDKIHDYVKVLKPKDVKDYEAIRVMLDKKLIDLDQPEHGTITIRLEK
jgi:hypothetical protein